MKGFLCLPQCTPGKVCVCEHGDSTGSLQVIRCSQNVASALTARLLCSVATSQSPGSLRSIPSCSPWTAASHSPLGNLHSPHCTGTLCPPFPAVAAFILVEERNQGEFLCSIWFFGLQWLKQKDLAPALSRAPANRDSDPRTFPL